jgi:predicted RNA-binding protein YlqC (UPF0109 family)
MKELIKFIAQELVDFPDQVSVEEIEGNQTSVIELKVAKADLGKVIGKQGRTARAMRTLLSAASAKSKNERFLKSSSRFGPGRSRPGGPGGPVPTAFGVPQGSLLCRIPVFTKRGGDPGCACPMVQNRRMIQWVKPHGRVPAHGR